jgi:MFS family permease
MQYKIRFQSFLAENNKIWFVVFASLAAFATYSCMYAFRKPFTALSYSSDSFWGVDYKILLLTAQIIGYTLSKFLGIKFVPEIKLHKRAQAIILLTGLAGLALLGFALVKPPFNMIFMFLNGIPLGMIWGLVFSYLEGRKQTEVLGAVLCVSFIFSSGFVKSVGLVIMKTFDVSEFWMPFVTALVFFIPLIFFVFILNQLPPPNKEDVELRTERKPMNKTERKQLLSKLSFGIVILTVIYIMLTVFRDLRDNFAVELWSDLGVKDASGVLTTAEIPISIFVLILTGLVMFFKNNKTAFKVILIMVISGFILTGLAGLLFDFNAISPFMWMVLMGAGLYMGYVPFNAILFERLLAAFKYVGTVSFLIYIADAFGYLGSIGVYFYRNFFSSDISWLKFFNQSSLWFSIIGVTLGIITYIYFNIKLKSQINGKKN